MKDDSVNNYWVDGKPSNNSYRNTTLSRVRETKVTTQGMEVGYWDKRDGINRGDVKDRDLDQTILLYSYLTHSLTEQECLISWPGNSVYYKEPKSGRSHLYFWLFCSIWVIDSPSSPTFKRCITSHSSHWTNLSSQIFWIKVRCKYLVRTSTTTKIR